MQVLKMNSKQAIEFYNNYILDSIDQEDYEGHALETDQAKLEFLAARFISEGLYPYELQRCHGNYAAVVESWLTGLATNLLFYNYDIIQLAIKAQTLAPDYTERQGETVTNNYWRVMAQKIVKLWEIHNINYKG